MINHFYFNPGVFDYGFSETHPLKPERLHRMFDLLNAYTADLCITADPVTQDDLLRVHDPDYLDAVKFISGCICIETNEAIDDLRTEYGFWGDNPAFPGMYEAAAAYTGTSATAARSVVEGAAMAFAIGGGLHHALSAKASGFCIFNDCAVACSILRDKFERVAYVDIDVHHGDGVQWIFYNDPTVLTCSIHEEGRSLWPGTGWMDETGADFTSFNVPIAAGTTREVWFDALRRTIIPALQTWKPEAIVLQMGTDTHYLDPLAHILSDQSAWLRAVLAVQALDLPLVVLGGGGYNLTTVPRMWTSAILSLSGISYADEIPENLAGRVGAKFFSDIDYPYRRDPGGAAMANKVIDHLVGYHIPKLG